MNERGSAPDEIEIGWLAMRHPAFATVSCRLRQLGFVDEVDVVNAMRQYAIELHREAKALEARCGLHEDSPVVLHMLDHCILIRDESKRTMTSRLRAGSRDNDFADRDCDVIEVGLNSLFAIVRSCEDNQLLAAVERLATSLRESEAVVKDLRRLECLVREAVENG